MTIKDRITALQEQMKKYQLQAYIISDNDPHMSEYTPEHWHCRQWISGFSGSMGTVVVTLESAGLWTDGRYFLQAETELAGSGIDLYKTGLPDTLLIDDFLLQEVAAEGNIGVDGRTVSYQQIEDWDEVLSPKGISLVSVALIDEIWIDRPALPDDIIKKLDAKYAGVSHTDKIAALRQKMKEADTEAMLISTLDDIGWILNVRGSDVAYNPVVISYLLITEKKVFWFVDEDKLIEPVEGITIKPYHEIFDIIATGRESSIWVDETMLNADLYEEIHAKTLVEHAAIPSTLMKAVKNPVELENIRQVMIKDGTAMVQLLYWIEMELVRGTVKELDVIVKAREFRAQQKDFVSESFHTICGYQANGAIIHYSVTPDSNTAILPKGLLLVDSGGQYFGGTTDLTRTIAVGDVTEEQKRDYTLVLKGHIALDSVQFPENTYGCHLDILARKVLWDNAMNYHHGTGHGVGFFMNVHEGPQSIRPDSNPQPLETGMVISNEPGLYREGKHGIRIENLVTVKQSEKSEFGQFLQFETLTLCPIDTKVIEFSLLTKQETAWLNNYHQIVYDRLSPQLDNEHKQFLREKTKAV